VNYFTIGGRRYRAEIRESPDNRWPEKPFFVSVESIFCGEWTTDTFDFCASRPAARRALAREIDRLAIGPNGKRANWSVVYAGEYFAALAESAGWAANSMRVFADATRDAARKIIERAAGNAGISVGEFVRQVRGEVRA